nr:unnamed protein product [Spirometra erinaceieuropaei]
MVGQLHDAMTARVTNNGSISEAFAVTNGMKQGSVLAPTLFGLMFSAMLMEAYPDARPGIRIAYRTDGHFLNSRYMQTFPRLSANTVHDLLFAYYCALNTTTEEIMGWSVDLPAAGCACGSSRLLTLRLCYAAFLSASHSLPIRCWDARGLSLASPVLIVNQRCPSSDWLADAETTKGAHTRWV